MAEDFSHQIHCGWRVVVLIVSHLNERPLGAPCFVIATAGLLIRARHWPILASLAQFALPGWRASNKDD